MQSLPTERKKLRIAIVTENFLPKVDGVTRTLAKLLEHLQAQGHTAIVLGPRSEIKQYAGHKICHTRGIPLLIYPSLSLLFFRPLFIRRLLAFQPDVVHFVDPIWLGAQTLPAVQCFLPDAALISSYHTNLATYAALYGMPWLQPIIWRLTSYLHNKCSLTYCPSPSTAETLLSKGFDSAEIWSRGVDTELFNPEKRCDALRASWNAQDRVVFIYVGRLGWEKNLRLLVETFRGMDQATNRLVFVGDGPANDDLQSLCGDYGIDAIFAGYRKGEDLTKYYASADIFAFPSWTETYGQVVTEAMKSGLPVIGLRAEGVQDLVQHDVTGLLVDPVAIPQPSNLPVANRTIPWQAATDPTSPTYPSLVLAYRILLQELAGDALKREAMSKAAIKATKNRSWFHAMEQIVDGYHRVHDISTADIIAKARSNCPDNRPNDQVMRYRRRKQVSIHQWLAVACRFKEEEDSSILGLRALELRATHKLFLSTGLYARALVMIWTLYTVLIWMWKL